MKKKRTPNLHPQSKAGQPMAETNFVDMDNTRTDEQRDVMQRIIDAGDCPFCEQNLKKYHTPPTLHEGKYWLVTTNKWPYDHTKHHFLLIHKQHIEMLSEVSPEAAVELFEHFAWLEKEYHLVGGGVGIRFGDTNYSAGTVKHLHAQLIIPSIDDPDFEPTRIKIGKKKK